ncbi:SUMF1/EgtB/PvdO family nonheme iron enzyme [Amphritea sp. HPY]|uniref:SUMF1/EgtB/PvdO family nonheme iron enzyme n=1 Tax=Amphritea sp. HPY TaxID=3421652 RepID=UPI003D7EE670
MGNSKEPLYKGLQAGQIIGPDHHQFKLTSQLKDTALGQLWNAEDQSTSTLVPVTLQIFDPTLLKHKGFIDTIQKHVSLSKKIKHPHLAEFYGIFKHKNVMLFYATEILDGLTLAQLFNNGMHKKLSAKQKQGLLLQLALAIDSAHTSIASPHKAITPEVIFINKQGGVKLTGFGLDDGLKIAGSIQQQTAELIAYQAPEAFHPDQLSTRADIYSFACIIYQLYTGKAPFKTGEDEASRVRKELKRPADMNSQQWQLMEQAFATDPEERPAKAADLLKQINAAASDTADAATEQDAALDDLSEKKKVGVFNIPRWVITLLIFSFGFLLGFTIAFFIGLNNTNDVQQALTQTREQLEQVQLDIAELQQTLVLEREERSLETAQLQQALDERIGEVSELKDSLLAIKYDDPDKLTVFTDQLEDGFKGPQMVIVPRGVFTMGDQQLIGDDNELPSHEVTINHRFAIARNEVTFKDYDYYATSMGRPLPKDNGWGRGNRPVINVSWKEAKAYTQWLALLTGQPYRLPTEAEWEYIARAGTKTNYWWGDSLEQERAVCDECGTEWDGKKTAPVASFPANSWSIHDMNGNVDEWVEDCYQSSYFGAPADGSAMIEGDCQFRVMRGGSWFDIGRLVRSSSRYRHSSDAKKNSWGFRIALDLPDKTTEE